MKTQLLDQAGERRTYAVVLETGDEVMSCLSTFAREADLDSAQITGIGAFSDASLQYFCWTTKQYVEIPIDRRVEVVVLGDRDGSAMAGHLGKAHVRPTLEVIVTESPNYLNKEFDPESGLALIRPG